MKRTSENIICALILITGMAYGYYIGRNSIPQDAIDFYSYAKEVCHPVKPRFTDWASITNSDMRGKTMVCRFDLRDDQ